MKICYDKDREVKENWKLPIKILKFMGKISQNVKGKVTRSEITILMRTRRTEWKLKTLTDEPFCKCEQVA